MVNDWKKRGGGTEGEWRYTRVHERSRVGKLDSVLRKRERERESERERERRTKRERECVFNITSTVFLFLNPLSTPSLSVPGVF